jgi:signal peptidase I
MERKNASLFVLIGVIFVCAGQLYLPRNAAGFAGSACLAAWAGATALLRTCPPYVRLVPRKLNAAVLRTTATAGAVFIVIYFIGGIMLGFERNAAAPPLPAVLFGTGAPFREYVRSSFVKSRRLGAGLQRTKKEALAVAAATALFTLAELFELSFTFDRRMAFAELLGGEILTLVLLNILSGCICLCSRSRYSTLCRAVTQIFPLLSPYIPKTIWVFDALVSAFISFTAILFVRYYCSVHAFGLPDKKRRESHPAKSIPIGIAALAFVLFVSGALPARPVAVATASMAPEIKIGDMVVIANCEAGAIRKGDVVAYRMTNHMVIHRVVDIYTENGETVLQTKGDANNAPDRLPVTEDQLLGKAVFKADKIGYLTLWFNSVSINDTEIEVETGQ